MAAMAAQIEPIGKRFCCSDQGAAAEARAIPEGTPEPEIDMVFTDG